MFSFPSLKISEGSHLQGCTRSSVQRARSRSRSLWWSALSFPFAFLFLVKERARVRVRFCVRFTPSTNEFKYLIQLTTIDAQLREIWNAVYLLRKVIEKRNYFYNWEEAKNKTYKSQIRSFTKVHVKSLAQRKSKASKLLSVSRVLEGLKICPPRLNKRSTDADDGNAVLYRTYPLRSRGYFSISSTDWDGSSWRYKSTSSTTLWSVFFGRKHLK